MIIKAIIMKNNLTILIIKVMAMKKNLTIKMRINNLIEIEKKIFKKVVDFRKLFVIY